MTHYSGAYHRLIRVLVIAVCVAGLVVLCASSRPALSSPSGCASRSVAEENALPGGTGWSTEAAVPLVQGYATSTSVYCGRKISFKLGTQNSRPVQVLLQAWRLGYYGGAGGRLVWVSSTLTVRRPLHWDVVARGTHTLTAPWKTTLTLTIPHTWTQGVYAFRIVPVHASSSAAVIPVVIRDPTQATAFVHVLAVNTWQMYNSWGGWSAYTLPRTYVSSFDRPYQGAGWGDLLQYEYPLVRYMERAGDNVSYATDVDLNVGDAQLASTHALLFGGHSEYWTTQMRAHLEQYFAAGTNAVFFGGNNMFWRPVPVGPSGGAYRRLMIWRVPSIDPHAQNSQLASENWRSPIINQPEQTTLGEQYGCDGVRMPLIVPSPSLGWMFQGTGAIPGQVLPGVNGYEVDYPNAGVSVPTGTQLVAEQTFACPHRKQVTSGAAITIVPGSGPQPAMLVDMGTEDWSCNLSDACMTDFVTPYWLVPSAPITPGVHRNDPVVEHVIQGATRNVLNVVGAGPAGWQATASPYPLVQP